MSALIHVIYASAATVDFDDDALKALMEKSRSNNQRYGITGMLLFTEGDFIQIMEGPESTVDERYNIIAADSRHNSITKIIRESIAERAFKEWTMGFAKATRGELARIDGFNDFFDTGACFRDLDNGRAKRLLKAFAGGRWRSSNSEGVMGVKAAS